MIRDIPTAYLRGPSTIPSYYQQLFGYYQTLAWVVVILAGIWIIRRTPIIRRITN